MYDDGIPNKYIYKYMFDVFMTFCMTCMHYAPINRRILLHQENGHVNKFIRSFCVYKIREANVFVKSANRW